MHIVHRAGLNVMQLMQFVLCAMQIKTFLQRDSMQAFSRIKTHKKTGLSDQYKAI